MGSQIIEREVLLESEGNLSTLCSTIGSQSIHSDSIRPFAASGEEQSEKEKENQKYTHSPSYCDNRSALSSVVGLIQIEALRSTLYIFFILHEELRTHLKWP